MYMCRGWSPGGQLTQRLPRAPTCVVTSPQAREASTSPALVARRLSVALQAQLMPAGAPLHTLPLPLACLHVHSYCLPAREQLVLACACLPARACLRVRSCAALPSAAMRAPGCSRWLSVNNGTPFLTFLCMFGCEQALPRHHRPGAWEVEMQPSPFPRWQRGTSRAAGPGSEPAGYPTQGAQPAGHPRRLARALRAPSRAIARPMLPPQLPRITGQYPKESRQTVVVLFLKFLDPTPSPPYHSRCAPSFRLRSSHATRASSESSCYSSHLRSPSPRLCLLAGAPSRPVRAWRVPDQTLTECTTPESGPNSRLHSRDLLHTCMYVHLFVYGGRVRNPSVSRVYPYFAPSFHT